MRIKLYSKQRIVCCKLDIQCYIMYEDEDENEFLNASNIIDLYVHRSKKYIPDFDEYETVFEGFYEIHNNFVIVKNEPVEIQSLYVMKEN